MPKVIVRTIGLTKVYRRGKVNITALKDVDLQIPMGEIACIMGPSGSGKTTLLNLIGGLADYRLRKIGFIFQFYNLIPTLTAQENVEVPLALAKVPKRERRDRALALLATVGLESRADHKPDELSGGEQQRVAIARALANNPSLMLADEPTGDLDSKSAITFMKLVKELNQKENRTFIIVTHDPLVVEQSTRTYTIRDGRIETAH